MSEKRINPRRPVPASGYDRLRQNLESGFADGFPVEKFPAPDNRANINRGTITTRKDDTVKDVSIGLQDHDEAIVHYFNEIIKPSVISNGDRINVPIMYGAPERWKAVQQDGYFRDKEGKLQVPLIMFKRNSVEKRRDLGNKMDGNNPQLYYTFQERYTRRNQYDNFSILQGRIPQKQFHAIVVPDFITLNYTCTIWCDYISQMNKLIESINYSSDSYWGDKDRFKFNAKIDTFSNTTELNIGDNRIVKTNFGLKLQGYLVPNSINKELTQKPPKFFSKSTVVFNDELSVQPTGEPKTREEVRSQHPVNVQQSYWEDGVIDASDEFAIPDMTISEDITWTNSMEVNASITVLAGVTLIIQGDLTVNAEITNYGNIIIHGLKIENAPITLLGSGQVEIIS